LRPTAEAGTVDLTGIDPTRVDLTRVDPTRVDLAGRAEVPLAGFVDARTGVRLELHHPLASPATWRAYLDGAEVSYRAHGVSCALPRAELEDGRATALFFVAVDAHGRVVGGIRAHGPLAVPDEAYALRELAGHPRLADVRALLAGAVPAGVVELKGAWVDRAAAPAALSDALARCHVHAMTWLGAGHALCTCSDRVAPRWATAGGRAFAELAPVAYPDERYRTVLLWWDRGLVAELASPAQLAELEREAPLVGRHGRRWHGAPAPRPAAGTWRAEVLDDRDVVDAARVAALRADPHVEVLDRLAEQRAALAKVRGLADDGLATEPARWVHYPWRRALVRVLGPRGFRALRLDRNRNKVTAEEQDRLAQLRVGVVGLSVGHAIAHTLALEGSCGGLRLADFDELELSNLNRIPGTVLDLGLNKAAIVARRVAEIDPYLDVEVVPEGLTEGNVDAFVDGLDVLVEECDSLDVKALVRDRARARRIPVLMETSDRGLLDVERFDLEPDRAIFHGLLGDVEPADLMGLSTHDKVPHVLRILEPDQLSSRMAASMAEIDETLTTWPQLGGDVALGGATIAAAVRRIGLGRELPSGRTRIDLDRCLRELAEPVAKAAMADVAVVLEPAPADPARAVAHAANLAPSGGNTQPWSLALDDERLRIALDRSRTSKMDVRFRGSYVAIGAGLLNARIAAAHHGVLGTATAFPRGEDDDLVAELAFGEGRDDELAALYPTVLERSANRRAGDGRALPAGLLADLDEQVGREGGRLHVISGRQHLDAYAELLGESDRLRFLSPRLHAEMMGELRWPGEDPLETGIDVRTLELDKADVAKLSVARRADVMADLASWDGGRALGEVTRERVRSSSALAVVTVGDARPASFVAGGAAVQRLWLACSAAGVGVQPVSPVSVFAADDADVRGLVPPAYVGRVHALTDRLRRLAGLAEGEVIALVVRLSNAGAPSVRSTRLPLDRALGQDAFSAARKRRSTAAPAGR
jgi:molybdopterin/thiamine biosynthesis adenylyltransferase